jgi:hypothetical protein
VKASDVVRQLFNFLPRHTGLFSDDVPVSSITRSGATVTVVTSSPHGLLTNQYVNIMNSLAPNTITNLTRALSIKTITRSGSVATVETDSPHFLAEDTLLEIQGAVETEYNILTKIGIVSATKFYYRVNGTPATPATGAIIAELQTIAIATTSSNHDLSMSQRTDGQTLTVSIVGATEIEYNGIKRLLAVPNRRSFYYEVAGTPSYPATGSPALLENLKSFSYNGRHKVNVISPTSFTYTITGTPGSPAQGTPILRVRSRISKAVSVQRMMDSYTSQLPSKCWAWVVLENPIASKSRDTQTDATARIGTYMQYRQPRIEQFSVYVFVPTTNEIAAANARDLMEDVAKYLIKSLVGVKFPSVFVGEVHDSTVYVGEVNSTENTAFYIHQFIFESTIDITQCDIIEPDEIVAFRDIHVDYGVTFQSSDDVILESDIDLDEDPL